MFVDEILPTRTSIPGVHRARPDAAAPGLVPDIGAADPDHHLWRNGRLFWVAFTIHIPARWQKHRVRRSLGTADLEEARRRRDELIASYGRTRGIELSLRPAPRRGPRKRACDANARAGGAAS